MCIRDSLQGAHRSRPGARPRCESCPSAAPEHGAGATRTGTARSRGNGCEPRSPGRRRCRTPPGAATREGRRGTPPSRPVTCSCRPPNATTSGARPRTPSRRRCGTRRGAGRFRGHGPGRADRRATASRWLATRAGDPARARPGRTPPPRPSPATRIAIRAAGSDHPQRLGDPSGDELIVARRVWTLMKPDLAFASHAVVRPGLFTRQRLGETMRTIAARRNAQIALPTMPWRTVVPRETHPRPTVTRARTDHPRLAPALARRRHAATVCTGTDSPATHLRVHSAPENAPGDALGGPALVVRGVPAR